MNKIKVPEAFLLPPLFLTNEEIPVITFETILKTIKEEPLSYDIAHYLNIPSPQPWQEKNEYIPILLEAWGETEPIIASFFKERNRDQAMEPMRQMSKLYIAFLFWSNDRPVPSLMNLFEEIEHLPFKPVNVLERLRYIVSTPNHHHAFTQLKELFIEQRKKWAVSNIK